VIRSSVLHVRTVRTYCASSVQHALMKLSIGSLVTRIHTSRYEAKAYLLYFRNAPVQATPVSQTEATDVLYRSVSLLVLASLHFFACSASYHPSLIDNGPSPSQSSFLCTRRALQKLVKLQIARCVAPAECVSPKGRKRKAKTDAAQVAEKKAPRAI